MKKLTKFDVVSYLSVQDRIGYRELAKLINQNISFQKTSERTIQTFLRELKKEGLILKEKNMFYLNIGEKKLQDLLTFLLWCKKDSMDFNTPFKSNIQTFYKTIF